MAPMLAVRSVTMSLATTVFVLKKPAWLLWHNVANVSAICLAAIIAWQRHAGLLGFLELLALLQGLEYAMFGAVIARAVWLQRQAQLGREAA